MGKSLSLAVLLASGLALPAQAFDLIINDQCREIFAYLESTTAKIDSAELRQILGIPASTKKFAQTDAQPIEEIKRAIHYVSNYFPPQTDTAPVLTLAQHRTQMLRRLIDEISIFYPDWGAAAKVTDEGDYIFRGAKGDYIIISRKDGSLTQGSNK